MRYLFYVDFISQDSQYLLPSHTKTTRGTGADIIIIDEAAHIDPALFYKTILPILQMKNTSLLALSSPEGNENYYSQLLGLQDDKGDPWFKVVRLEMVCGECKKGDRAKQLACNHVRHTAHWLSKRKFARLKKLYEHAEGTALREFGGLAISDHIPCFHSRDIEIAFSANRVVTQTAPGVIFMAADPNGGGPSHMAVTSGFFDGALNFVVSLICATERFLSQSEHFSALFLLFFAALDVRFLCPHIVLIAWRTHG